MKHRTSPAEQVLLNRLEKRKKTGLLRKLPKQDNLVDFHSNDYLGLSRSDELKLELTMAKAAHANEPLGSTGSRLLSGNTAFAEQLEQYIAAFHEAETALLFNSGYTANLGLFSSLSQKGSTIIMDEMIHSSIIDGWRIGFGNRLKFKHNDLVCLEAKLKTVKGISYVAVESVYSMDGDLAPLMALNKLCKKYGALLIVDEAHALGVFGKGLVNLTGLTQDIFATIITFGKALGAHGAVVLGSKLLRDYLVNFARSFIYSTAMSFSQLLHIKVAYKYLQKHEALQHLLQYKIHLFHGCMTENAERNNLNSPIKAIIIPGNEQAVKTSYQLARLGMAVYPILSPTVPKGCERLRICLHTHNTDRDIERLCQFLLYQPTLKLQ